MKGRQGIVDFIKGQKQQDSKWKTGFSDRGKQGEQPVAGQKGEGKRQPGDAGNQGKRGEWNFDPVKSVRQSKNKRISA